MHAEIAIGDFISFSHKINFGYEDTTAIQRRMIKYPVCGEAACGFVCGAKRFYEGEIVQYTETDDYSGEVFGVKQFVTSKIVYAWIVRKDMLSREIYVLHEDIISVRKSALPCADMKGIPARMRETTACLF